MTSLTTAQMVEHAHSWLDTQTESTPRDILQALHDMSVALLAPSNPPRPPVVIGELNGTTEQLIELGHKRLYEYRHLPPYDFLVSVRDGAMGFLQQLPNWRGAMFFPKQGGGVDSSLNFANIDGHESSAHQRYTCEAIARNGGDTLLFIAEKLYNNPGLKAKVNEELKYAVKCGLKHLIIDLKNDNKDFPWSDMESYIAQMANDFAWANSDQVAFMNCLESDEVLSIDDSRQMYLWSKKYAPTKRFIIGSANSDYLKAVNCGAELWLEIHTPPFELSQADADQYIVNLQALLPYGPVWAGEYWNGSSDLSKYITHRAREIGCVGTGSHVQ